MQKFEIFTKPFKALQNYTEHNKTLHNGAKQFTLVQNLTILYKRP